MMNTESHHHLVAADVGNSSLKIGVFSIDDEPGRWTPRHVVRLDHDALANKLAQACPSIPCHWCVIHVHRPGEMQLAEWIRSHRPDDTYTLLNARDFPLIIDVPNPDRVGTDRLAGAVAVNQMRCPNQPAIVVDVGTAITVDLVSADGVFRGGAILPGLGTAAAALAGATDALPSIMDIGLTPMPDPVGKSTEAAIRSGIAWGCVGAVKQLIDQFGRHLPVVPSVFCTGGAGQGLAKQLGHEVRFDPHLVLRGVALAANTP